MHQRLLLLTACLFALLLGGPSSAKASHIVGEEIESICLNACTTRVALRVYRDCTGSAFITNNITFSPTGSCSSAPAPITNWSVQQIIEVTPICPTVATACSTPGAPINGIEEYYWFRDYDVCNLGSTTNCTFAVSWNTCCRNSVITSGAANGGIYIENQVDFSAGCNNSPQFTNYPLFMACQGQPYTIHQGAYDPDGDSLSFTLTACQGSINTPVIYGTGYSPTAPLGPSWQVNFDPVTGMMELVPQPGNLVVGVICFAVDEWRNGQNIGTTYRDMQVQVLTCPANSQPTFSTISNLSAGAALTVPNIINFCGSGQLCFDISASDADSATQSISLMWDANITGATFSQVGNPTVTDTITTTNSSPAGRFCWTPTSPGVYQFLLSVEDNACPIAGQQEQLITINVGGTNTSANLITQVGVLDTCSGTFPTLTATGGYTNYFWNNNATTQSIVATVPGTYTLLANNGGACGDVDTVVVVDQSQPEITGTIFTSTAQALANQKVYLIGYDTTLNALFAEDSTFTNGFGVYSFCGVNLDTVYIKAAPDSATYPTQMPTYADTAVWWNNATAIAATSFPTVVNFQTRFGTNPGGPGFIGGLIAQGANKNAGPGDPMPNVTVVLYSKTQNYVIDQTVTDANGYFSFVSIPFDDYAVSVDVPGVDNINVPSLLVDAATPSYDSLDFRLHTTYFELVLPVSLPPRVTDLQFTAYPNPARGASTIALELPSEQDVSVQVYDIRGAAVAELTRGILVEGTHRWTFDAQERGLGAGVYFIRLQTPDRTELIKLVQMND